MRHFAHKGAATCDLLSNPSSWLAKAFAHSQALHTHWPIKNSECQKKSLECTFLIFKNQQKWQVIFTCKAMHWIIEGTVKPWQGDSIVEIIPECTLFENHSQPAKQTAAESNQRHSALLRARNFANFPFSLGFCLLSNVFQSKVSGELVFWNNSTLCSNLAQFLNYLEKFANKFSKGGYIFIPI